MHKTTVQQNETTDAKRANQTHRDIFYYVREGHFDLVWPNVIFFGILNVLALYTVYIGVVERRFSSWICGKHLRFV